MTRTKIRKTGLGFCMALMILPAFTVGFSPYQAHAQLAGTTFDPSLISVNIGNPATLGPTLVQGLASGYTPGSLTTFMQNAGASAATTQSMTAILTGISGNANVNAGSASAVLTGVLSGNLTGAQGFALSQIPGLGNLTSTAVLGQLASNPNIKNIMDSLSPIQGSEFLTKLLGVATSREGLQQLATQAGIQALQGVLQNLSPQIAALFGDALGGALGTMLQGLLSGDLMGGLNSILGLLPGGLGDALSGILGGGGGVVSCCNGHPMQVPSHYDAVRQSVSTELDNYRTWFVTTFWEEHVRHALGLFAAQMTATGIFQVQMIGTMLDAKHQLETQRLFQQLMAQAHKNYQPSEGMCTFATLTRSLIGSERRADLAKSVFAERMNQRQTLSGRNIAREEDKSDTRSRLEKFRTTYCDPNDNQNGLGALCPNPGTPARRNMDIDYTRNIESRLTLDVGFYDDEGVATPDEQDVFALSANLFSHNIAPRVDPNLFGGGGLVRTSAAETYMNLRSVFAKRSVAQNSFAALTAMRARGDAEAAPYAKAMIAELGITDPATINEMIGQNPSYFAYMEVLTKKAYQWPGSYTALIDTPANVDRKITAMQAIGLIQDRDMYESLIRSEMVLSVLLETMLQKEQEKVSGALVKAAKAGGV